MFTGLIHTTGTIRAQMSGDHHSGRLIIQPAIPIQNPMIGESIAVNGACLTLETAAQDGTLTLFTLAETLRKTNLGEMAIGRKVNLERALRPTDRLGGHFVSGHVDTTTALLSLKRTSDDVVLTLKMQSELRPFLIPKGSVCIDGISLTLVEITTEYFTVHLIPSTLEMTALTDRRPLSQLNIETDMIGKYLYHQQKFHQENQSSSLTLDTLIQAGW